jgi:hypothetical protein
MRSRGAGDSEWLWRITLDKHITDTYILGMPTKPKPQREVTYVRFDAPVKRALEQAALEEGRSLSSLLRKVAIDWVAARKGGK